MTDAQALRNPKIDTWDKQPQMNAHIPAELQFQLARLAPDEFFSPFVKDGSPLDLPVQRLVGNYHLDVSVQTTHTINYALIFNTGFAANFYNGGAGSNYIYRSNTTLSTTLNQDNVLNGYALSDVFGTATYYDKLRIWAAVLDIELIALAAQMNGVVHVGVIPVASLFGGVTVGDLVKMADRRYDVKDPAAKIIRLRSGIVNREAIHKINHSDVVGWQLDDIREEYISFAIYENVTSSLGSGGPLPYGLNIGTTALATWWPEGSQPLVRGLASACTQPMSEVAPMKPIDTANAAILEKSSHLWGVPANIKEIWNKVCSKETLKGVLGVLEKAYPPIGLITGLVASPILAAAPAPIRDDLAYLRLCDRMDNKRLNFQFWSPEALSIFDDMEDRREDLIDQLESDYSFALSRKSELESLEKKSRMKHGQLVETYYRDGEEVDIAKLMMWEEPPQPQITCENPRDKSPNVAPPKELNVMDGFVRVGRRAGSQASSLLSER